MLLNYCPFCGCEDITLETLDQGDMEQGGFGWMAQCTCTHCQAKGSYNGGCETEDDARNVAVENWNEAGRKVWYHHIFDVWDGIVIRFERLFD